MDRIRITPCLGCRWRYMRLRSLVRGGSEAEMSRKLLLFWRGEGINVQVELRPVLPLIDLIVAAHRTRLAISSQIPGWEMWDAVQMGRVAPVWKLVAAQAILHVQIIWGEDAVQLDSSVMV